MRTLLTLVLSALAVLPALAQTPTPSSPQPELRPYAAIAAGRGVLPNRHEASFGTRTRDAGGWSGTAELGAVRGQQSVGLRVEAFRSRIGDDADLRSLLPSDDWADARQVNALVVARQSYRLGPVDLAFGTGAGVSVNVSYVQQAPTSASIRDGVITSQIETVRETRVFPLLHADGSVGRVVGHTFVGVNIGSSSSLGDDSVARYGVEVRRTF